MLAKIDNFKSVGFATIMHYDSEHTIKEGPLENFGYDYTGMEDPSDSSVDLDDIDVSGEEDSTDSFVDFDDINIFEEEDDLDYDTIGECKLYGWGTIEKNGNRIVGFHNIDSFRPYPTYIKDKQKDYVYYGEMFDGKYGGKGNLIYNDKRWYSGDFKNGHMHGKGNFFYGRDTLKINKYEGDFVEGKRHGTGTYHFYDNHRKYIYIGEFSEDKMTGKGELAYNHASHQGEKYTGTFIDGKLNGIGRIYYNKDNDALFLEGMFKDGKILDGEGKQYYKKDYYRVTIKDGKIYNSDDNVYLDGFDWKYYGKIKNGEPHGKGSLIIYNVGLDRFGYGETEYVGSFINGKMHGQGISYTTVIHSSIGGGAEIVETIFGTWQNDKLHGDAIICMGDGSKIECHYEYGNRCGQATLIDPDGIRIKGVYKDKKFKKNESYMHTSFLGTTMYGYDLKKGYIGAGRIEYADGTWYEGSFDHDKYHGQGELHFPNGNYYIGEFKNGVIDGDGEFYYKNGDCYIGKVTGGEVTGEGIYKYANGDVHKGFFENGIRKGYGIFYRFPIKTSEPDPVMPTYFGSYKLMETIYEVELYALEGMWNGNTLDGDGYILLDNETKFAVEFNNCWPCSSDDYNVTINDDSCSIAVHRNGKAIGKGVTLYRDGDCFVCHYQGGIICEVAKRYNKDNDALQYYYVDGEETGPVLICRDGREFDVEIVDGKLEGTGFYEDENSSNIFVEFKNDGCIFSEDKITIKKDGYTYYVKYKDGLKTGDGMITNPDGTIIRGAYVNGVLQGEGVVITSDGAKLVNFVDGKINRN